jgi:dynein intermediate chain 1
MPPKKAAYGKGSKNLKKTKAKQEEEQSENNQEDEDVANMDNPNQIRDDIEDLTQEEKDSMVYKKLVSLNPQAPPNITKFNFCKNRGFATDDVVDQLVMHYCIDGDMLLAESEEARDQDDNRTNKTRKDKQLLD